MSVFLTLLETHMSHDTHRRSLSGLILRIPAGVLTAVVMAAILWLTLAPHPLPENDLPLFPGADKLVHACMFGGLYFIMALDAVTWRVAHARKRRAHSGGPETETGISTVLPVKMSVLFALAAILTGGAIELAQGAMGLGRGCDLFDFLADAAGVLLAVWLTPPVLRGIHG